MSARVKTVLFDVGSTLIKADPPVEAVFSDIAARRGHTLDIHEVALFMPEVFDFYEREYVKDGDFWCSAQGSVEIWLNMYRYLSRLCGIPEDAEGMAQGVYHAYRDARSWSAYKDVRPALMALKRAGCQLGVVSNWAPALQDLLRDLQLAPFFDEILGSAEVGYRKPDPQIFQLALERLGARADQTMHVGDLPEADGEGALAAGITPVIIDRHQDISECAFMKIASLEELPYLVATV